MAWRPRLAAVALVLLPLLQQGCGVPQPPCDAAKESAIDVLVWRKTKLENGDPGENEVLLRELPADSDEAKGPDAMIFKYKGPVGTRVNSCPIGKNGKPPGKECPGKSKLTDGVCIGVMADSIEFAENRAGFTKGYLSTGVLATAESPDFVQPASKLQREITKVWTKEVLEEDGEPKEAPTSDSYKAVWVPCKDAENADNLHQLIVAESKICKPVAEESGTGSATSPKKTEGGEQEDEVDPGKKDVAKPDSPEVDPSKDKAASILEVHAAAPRHISMSVDSDGGSVVHAPSEPLLGRTEEARPAEVPVVSEHKAK